MEFIVANSNFSSRDFVSDVIGREIGQVLRHTSAARLGRDPEGVHQLRVASRRLRSELRLLHPMLQDQWFTMTEKDLAWLGRTLGGFRNSDVLIALLEEIAAADDDLDRAVIDRAVDDRRAHQHRIVARLSGERYVSLAVTLARAVIRPPLRRTFADPESVIVSQLRESWNALRIAATEMIDSPADLHQIRILSKRARYVTEVATPIIGDGAQPIVERFVAIQDSLGHQRDLAAVRRFVTEWYQSPRAVRGIDPADAREMWLASVDVAGRVNPDGWREPLAEAMVLIDDMNIDRLERTDIHQLP